MSLAGGLQVEQEVAQPFGGLRHRGPDLVNGREQVVRTRLDLLPQQEEPELDGRERLDRVVVHVGGDPGNAPVSLRSHEVAEESWRWSASSRIALSAATRSVRSF